MWGGGHPGAGQVVTWSYRGTAWHPRSFFVSVGGRLAQDEGPSARRTEIWNLGRAPGGIKITQFRNKDFSARNRLMPKPKVRGSLWASRATPFPSGTTHSLLELPFWTDSRRVRFPFLLSARSSLRKTFSQDT